MRLDKLSITKFKNLRDFSIDFDQKSPVTVLVGENGTGKSNLLEALIIIFRDLDLGVDPLFKYEIKYYCRRNKVNHKVEIDADPNRKDTILIKVDGESLSYSKFQDYAKSESTRYLPSYVFGYYSGPSDRMEEHYYKHQQQYYDAIIRSKERPLRPLFYVQLVHGQFVLLSFFSKRDRVALNFLKKHLRIEGLESILFVMKEPPWQSKEGDPRFWNASGTVQDLLEKLYPIALAPMRRTQTVRLDFRRTTKLEHLYLYLKDADALERLAAIYPDPPDFFQALESTYISDLIKEVRIRVRIHNVDETLSFRDMSEGEQQLLMVLGLMRFTNREESLFLLDEPDTHLNPSWSLQYLDFLKEVVGEQKSSHLIMSTHDPLVLSGLMRSQVQIMQRDEETAHVYAETPEHDPKGMGIAAILTSEVFGLRSTLDTSTQRLMDERRELASKEKLNKAEKERLKELNDKLKGADLTVTMRDPLYQKFVETMTELEDPNIREGVNLTPKQRREQKELALQILRELEEEKSKA